MECKHELEDPNNNNNKLFEGAANQRICSHAGARFFLGFLIALNFVFIASVLYLHIDNLKLWKNIETQKKVIERLERQVNEKHDTSSVQAAQTKQLSVQKRQYQETNPVNRRNQHNRRNNRRRRHRRQNVNPNLVRQLINRLQCLILKPIVHLKAKGNRRNHAKQSHKAGCHSKCFTWEALPESHETDFEYVKDYSGAESLVTGIKILTPGFYEVYSQVVLNGPRVDSAAIAVGYETVKIPSSLSGETGTVVLMESFITQDNRGGVYHDSRNLKPVDAMNHMGTFQFSRDDIIVVRPKSNSRNAKFLPNTHQSYFGVHMINYETSYVESVMRGDLHCSPDSR